MKKINKKYLVFGIIGFIIILIVVFIIKDDNYIVLFDDDSSMFKNEYEELNDKEAADGKIYPSVKINNNNIKYIDLNGILNIL